jgi:hypothetical protein
MKYNQTNALRPGPTCFGQRRLHADSVGGRSILLDIGHSGCLVATVPSVSPKADAELLEAWGAGDKAAGEALFDRHFEAIYRFFQNKVGPGVIDDLVQQTFLGCVEAPDRFRGDSSSNAVFPMPGSPYGNTTTLRPSYACQRRGATSLAWRLDDGA